MGGIAYLTKHEHEALLKRIADFEEASLKLLEFRVGTLPRYGGLRDTDESRAALQRLAELCEELAAERDAADQARTSDVLDRMEKDFF